MSGHASIDWTQGGDGIAIQRCRACGHAWYFAREFCPACGAGAPETSAASGRGVVHAGTLVHRAPSDDFKALAPYRIVLVDLEEGVRVMGHADPDLAIGDRVRCTVRRIAGRPLPHFIKDSS